MCTSAEADSVVHEHCLVYLLMHLMVVLSLLILILIIELSISFLIVDSVYKNYEYN